MNENLPLNTSLGFQYINNRKNVTNNVEINYHDNHDNHNDHDNPDNEEGGIDKLKIIWNKLKDLSINLHFNNIAGKKSDCHWCTCNFDNPPIYIPKYEHNGTYFVYGCFCSPECACAFLQKENIDSSSKFERYHFLNHLYSKIYDYKKNIKPAPNPFYTLNKYYGNLTIQEYRQLFKSERVLLIIEKPLSRILPELHEDNNEFSILSQSLFVANKFSLKKKKKREKHDILNETFGNK